MPASASTCVPCASASPTVTASDCGGFERLPPLLGGERVGELVELPFENAVEVVHGDLYAVIRHAVLGEIVGPDLLRALAGADLRPPRCRLLRGLLLALQLEEPCAQDAERLRLVLELRLLVL